MYCSSGWGVLWVSSWTVIAKLFMFGRAVCQVHNQSLPVSAMAGKASLTSLCRVNVIPYRSIRRFCLLSISIPGTRSCRPEVSVSLLQREVRLDQRGRLALYWWQLFASAIPLESIVSLLPEWGFHSIRWSKFKDDGIVEIIRGLEAAHNLSS